MRATNLDTLETYNHTVDKYIETLPQQVSGDLKKWIDEALSNLDKTARILEIGSGSGKDATYFLSRGYKMELTDASTGFVDYLNQNGFSARLLNILEDDLGSGYDMIFADAVFLHFTASELRLALKKSFQAIKPRGRLAFALKAGDGEESTTRKLDLPRYFHFWSIDSIKEILEELNFRDVNIWAGKDSRGGERPDWLHIVAIR